MDIPRELTAFRRGGKAQGPLMAETRIPAGFLDSVQLSFMGWRSP
jgi:hypothetical protein